MAFNFANFLTLVRIILTPFIMHSIASMAWIRAGLLFTVAAATDFFDGYCARRWSLQTTLGSWLDPLADKLLAIGILIVCARYGYISWIPAGLIIAKECLLLSAIGIRYCLGGPVVIASNMSGKVAMGLLVIYYEIFFMRQCMMREPGIWWQTYAVYGVVVAHVWACLHYVYVGYQQVKIMRMHTYTMGGKIS
ncbi:MAG: CDP-alcohol phosphatidyltransferase family protein [Candidatus Babeliales bacterium]